MIYIENISDNTVKIKAPKKIRKGDFQKISPDIDSIIKKHKSIKILLDGTEFRGWDSVASFKQHIAFLLSHQQKVKKVAIITSHNWQRCLAGVMKIFLHPKIKSFDKHHAKEAQHWLMRK